MLSSQVPAKRQVRLEALLTECARVVWPAVRRCVALVQTMPRHSAIYHKTAPMHLYLLSTLLVFNIAVASTTRDCVNDGYHLSNGMCVFKDFSACKDLTGNIRAIALH